MKETETWIRIARCSDIPLREGRAVTVGSREIAIFNLGDRFAAVDNRCPHKGGPLADGIVSGTSIVCPLHAWKLSLETGNGVNGPSASSCVETFRTTIQDGIVYIELNQNSDEAAAGAPQEVTVLCVEPDEFAGTNPMLSLGQPQ